MAIWTIVNLERNTADGGVTTAHWRVTEENIADGRTYTASNYGAEMFSYDSSDPAFIPYEQLTEADVLTWVWGVVGKDEIEARLIADIEEQKSPKISSGIPW